MRAQGAALAAREAELVHRRTNGTHGDGGPGLTPAPSGASLALSELAQLSQHPRPPAVLTFRWAAAKAALAAPLCTLQRVGQGTACWTCTSASAAWQEMPGGGGGMAWLHSCLAHPPARALLACLLAAAGEVLRSPLVPTVRRPRQAAASDSRCACSALAASELAASSPSASSRHSSRAGSLDMPRDSARSASLQLQASLPAAPAFSVHVLCRLQPHGCTIR